ncbi:hypothetical protein [Corynebacterium sp. Marseille-P4321]|uniref:hypothetical protein n=1 Tax=Corynebacterium sp. Marseille-P4321 TaxID=2736603 RepID=UPI00158D10FC
MIAGREGGFEKRAGRGIEVSLEFGSPVGVGSAEPDAALLPGRERILLPLVILALLVGARDEVGHILAQFFRCHGVGGFERLGHDRFGAGVGVLVELLERLGDDAFLLLARLGGGAPGPFLSLLRFAAASGCFFLLALAFGLVCVFGRLRLRHVGLAPDQAGLFQQVEGLAARHPEALGEVFHGVVGAHEGSGFIALANVRKRNVDVGKQWQYLMEALHRLVRAEQVEGVGLREVARKLAQTVGDLVYGLVDCGAHFHLLTSVFALLTNLLESI